ncbi:MAG: DUF2752 domain-containing protein [Clostridia bacterium]|nr:DUF2752 domain-containing protein [Clostridia bacterium]
MPVVLSFMLFTDGKVTGFRFHVLVHEIGIPCFFKAATGYNCPVCGMTRSFIYMSAFDLKSAWSMNKAGVLLYLFCVLQVPYRLFLLKGKELKWIRLLVKLEIFLLIVIGLVTLVQFASQFIVRM